MTGTAHSNSSRSDPFDEGRRRFAVADGDWRRFRKLRGLARQRFSEDTLGRALAIAENDDESAETREQALNLLMKQREHERRALFEDFDRAHLPLLLHTMLQQGLVERDELTGLSLELRRALGLLT